MGARRLARAAGGARRLGLAAALLLWILLGVCAQSALATATVGAISGSVSDAASHAPVKGIEVCAINAELLAEPEEEEPGRAFGCAETDVRGDYTVPELSPEEGYEVVFAAPIGSPLNYVTEYYDGVVPPAEATSVTVVAGRPTAGVDAELAPGAQITGRVIDASTRAPIEDVAVCAYRTTGSGSLEVVSYAYTGASGEYAIAGLPSGSYGVIFISLGYVVQYYDDEPAAGAAAAVRVTAPQATRGIDAVLQPGSSSPPSLIFTPTGRTPPGISPIDNPLGPLPPGDMLVPITPGTLAVSEGRLTLAGTRVSVLSDGVALVRVRCAGSARCHGRVTLSAEKPVSANGRSTRRAVVIGKSPALSIGAGRKATLKIMLDLAGRTLLRAARGRLPAELALASAAGHRQESVLLTAQSARAAAFGG